jgi:signal transduction histidine kinase/CheY-like chemotaxis protein
MSGVAPGRGVRRSISSLTGRVVLAGAALVTGLAVVLVVLLNSIAGVDGARSARLVTDQGLTASALTQKALLDMETGLRGYVLTRDATFLAPWYQGLAAFPRQLSDLDRLSRADNAADRAVVGAIARQGRSYISDYGDPLLRRGLDGLSQAAITVSTVEGKRRVDSLRGLFARFNRDGSAQAQQKLRAAVDAGRVSRTVAIAGLGGCALLILFAVFYLTRKVAWPIRRIAGAADALSGGELSTRASTDGPVEVSQLGRSFNAMAVSIEQGSIAMNATNEQLKHSQADAERATEEAQHANQAKNEFLSRMSHELRTPLNAIIGFAQLLEMDELAGPQRESVGQVLMGGRHLLSLIDEVLDISRIESGTMRLSPEPIDLASAVSDAIGLIAPIAAERGVTLSSDLPVGSEIYVKADRQRLRQIVLNLLSNAVKYNSEGGEARLSVSITDLSRVQISVTDTGPGIAPEKMDRLFAPFDRLDAEQGSVPGTGLGLALSRSLAEAMNGSLTASSELGRGCVFTLEVDLAANPVGPATLRRAREVGHAGEAVAAGTLLYIEDNPSNFRLVEQLFSDRPDVRVIPAQQGGVGLDLARAHHPDLILLDLNLPDMSGAEVLERLLIDPITERIPVVILSADATQRDLGRLRSAGARDFLSKPLDLAHLMAIIRLHLPATVATR